MTPLARWVLLALLLAGAGAHPEDGACVRLCRARDRSTRVTGICDHHQTLVLQSDGGRLTQRLLRLCLTPCSGPGSPDDPLFDDSRACRVFREVLIRLQGCSCDSLEDDWANNPEEQDSSPLRNSFKDSDRLEDSNVQRKLDSVNGLLMKLKKIAADQPLGLNNFVERRENEEDLVEEKMRLTDEDDHLDDGQWQRTLDADLANLNTESPDEEEPPVDWEMWCMAQCDNGRGGSACNCDIIP